MLDSSSLPYAENIRLTRQVVETAHALGVGVEAELGALPDASGTMEAHTGRPTDPDEAVRFVTETGIDALAVSIGNVHVLTEGKANVDLARLRAIRQAVSIPLVIHGGTGYPESAIRDTIALGVAKVNFGTALKRAFLVGLAEAVQALPSRVDYHRAVGSRKEGDVLQQAKLRLRAEVAHRIRLWRPVYRPEGSSRPFGSANPEE
jgi:fructose/tagatose bisphosphate aldolase